MNDARGEHHHHDHDHHHHHHHHDHRDRTPDERTWSGRRGRSYQRGPGGHGGGHRARRGAVADAALVLLAERPMHGYELISELEERSGGRWRPSPGAVYPSLGRLEAAGLVSSADDAEGKKTYTLTDAGRERAARVSAADEQPWDRPERRGELRREVAELIGQVRQIGRFGSPSQVDGAREVLRTATRDLYQVLASGPGTEDEPGPT
jgi:DNA-binding PadR family transcriptional regulator